MKILTALWRENCSELNVDVTFDALDQAASKGFVPMKEMTMTISSCPASTNDVVLSGVVFTRSLGIRSLLCD